MWVIGGRHKMSPLILFAIFIFTSFSAVLSRHRIRHHRDRFKRQQGAHLYLPGSYVYDGDEAADGGPWSDWSSPSDCSRSCGGGVSSQSRQCSAGSTCQGAHTRHFSCNTQDCPDIADFRAQQCSHYDEVPFEGVNYVWVPYTKAPNPCELNCMPKGERFYYRYNLTVIDGTKCDDKSLDVCVQGQCKHVGCDMMLGSSVREDDCRRCGGDGSTCKTVSDRLEMQDLQTGYNDILMIPAGATNIKVQEIEPSNNYLAIRNTSGHFYLNGNWRIDFPRSIDFAGCTFHYERYPQGFAAPDKITCVGPITESLLVVLLFQEHNVGVDYEYSIPTNIQPSSEIETYAWTFDHFSPCTKTCGGGVQSRNVSCANRKTLEPVDRTLCDAANEPSSTQRCAEVPCDAQWEPYPWGNCSAACGQGGTQQRQIACLQITENGYQTQIDEKECAKLPKPPQEQACNEGRVCAQWHTGPWKPCDHLCGEGKEVRQVKCYRMEDGKIRVLDGDAECPEPKPEAEKKCNLRPCEGVDWITSEWSGCDKCGLRNETRKVRCSTAKGEIFADDLCDKEQKPKIVRECKDTNTSCEYLWYASQWSECSTPCGQGVQTRTLFCGLVTEDGSVQKVDNSKCNKNQQFDLMKNCTGGSETCPGEWFSGPWTDCSKSCGGGERNKKVVCLKDFVVVDPAQCGSDKIIFGKEDCNTQPCSEDTIIPTDVTKSIDESEPGTTETAVTGTEVPSLDEDYEIVAAEECDDGEWVDAEGDADEESTEPSEESTESIGEALLGSSTESSVTKTETSFSDDDLMLSDSPSSPDGTVGTTITGSGDGDPSTSDLAGSSTIEGSGDSDSSDVTKTGTTPMESVPTDSTVDASTISTLLPESSSSETSTDASLGTESTSDLSSTDVTISSTDSDDATISNTESGSSSSGYSSSSESATSDSTDSTPTDQSTEPTESTTDSSSTSTDSSDSTTDSASTTDSETTVSGSTESGTSDDISSISTTESGSTESGTSESGSTESGTSENTVSESTSEIGATESSTSESSITETSSTGSEGTSEGGSTQTDGSSTESSVTETGSTESGTEIASSSSTDGLTESSTTDASITTESGATDVSTTESSGATDGSTETPDYDIWSSTTESSTWDTTSIAELFSPKPRMCKRKKPKNCHKTLHGCCWDTITPAEGPFGKGCPTPKTCNESTFGCCEDGVSPALGEKSKGCPPSHCNETIFGCCPDNKTIAEGNDQEGCPPPPPACLKSKHGCCPDNTTEAKGPKHKGCQVEPLEESTTITPTTEEPPPQQALLSCTNSTHGCCPDGTTAANGTNFRGCVTECSNSTFGCCPDGTTPAHGYSGEGCCLSGPYGCCPDNIVPARGPNLEGCGCQYSPYRCCPDNATAARGHNNEGCGCEYTEFGCCPDDYTPAAAKEYGGCLCNTFQFGCCPDGVTEAKGPHQQGCGCRNTQFGCCTDDSTPAMGANKEGCGCASSKFGCCPDGTTEAGGEGFEGCSDIPINRQESCSQPKERGTCRNYTVRWFFDMEYGGCTRFWYGGCDGNDNRFENKEQCDEVCVKPQKTDRCNLPKVSGPCEGYYPQWYYDKERRHCTQFIYGGCLGNNNKFETKQECDALCVPDESTDACEQEPEKGPCNGNYPRWYFDKTTKMCSQFVYGGCKSNPNNFPSEESCKQQCAAPGRKKDHCSLPRAKGNCTERKPRWYFDIPEKRCLPFYYSGCSGNDNNFESREACESDCPKEIVKETCKLAADIGTCGNYTTRWYFDTKEKACRQFYYGGCEGNGNNFETSQQCEQRCDKTKPVVPQAPITRETCFLPSETGDCRDNASARFFYDRTDGVCKTFTYGGCGGNQNNFASAEECHQHCGNAQDLCILPPVVGPCNAEYLQYYYDGSTDSCQVFNYGGCGGNGNRFQDKGLCEQRCRRAPPVPEVPVTQAPQLPPPEGICYEHPAAGECNDSVSVFFFNHTTGACTPFSYTGCGGNGNRFNSEEQCERQCGQFKGEDVCSMDQDTGPCRGYFPKYFFDKASGRCAQFAYGGCNGNGNRFSSNEECESICVKHEEKKTNVTSNAVCRLSVDQGTCQEGYHKRWYFNSERGQCIAFIFSGCGGNLNNFKSFQACVDFCRDFLVETTPPQVSTGDHPCQAHFDQCATMKCPYGIEAYVDQDQCNKCRCLNPCAQVGCSEGTQCAIDINRNRTTEQEPAFIAICRQIEKPGECPVLVPDDGTTCEEECRNDADCSLQLKCCKTGCSTTCVEPSTYEVPGELVTKPPAHIELPIESEYVPPTIDVETYEPEVQGSLGDHVTVRCAVRGNPTPQITWSRGNLTIDGTEAKYRIKLDQNLQIINLHQTDSGIYLCIADNQVGDPITNQINLQVVDSNPRPASVLDQEDQPPVVVSLNAPATLNCLALGYPFPGVTWWKDDTMIPFKTSQFEVREDHSLLIHSVKLSNLGIYTCQAYNGIGKAASWSVVVKAKGPYYSTDPSDQQYFKYIVDAPYYPTDDNSVPAFRPDPLPVDSDVERRVPENRIHGVPVLTNISLDNQRFPTNSEVTIPCVVQGFPTPQVEWYKDGIPIIPSERIQITEDHRLVILQAAKSDSGAYQCEASNSYSKHSSSVTILVDGVYIHPNCKDNRFFANCNLIVKHKFCSHKYYAKFCCRSCTEAGLLSSDGAHLQAAEKQAALSNNLV